MLPERCCIKIDGWNALATPVAADGETAQRFLK
jgi:hypothetical protein